MLHVLTIVLPVFGLIALGFAARLSGLVGDRTGEGLSDFVFAIAVPALVFKTLTAAAIPASQPWGYWFAYFISVAIVWALGTWLARRYFGVDAVTGIVAGFCSAQANTVFVGVPLILEAYGDEGAVPLFLLIAIHLPIMVTVGSIFSEGRSTQLPRLVRQLVTNPILLGIFVSVAARLLDLAVPAPLKSMIDMLGNAASPCALFALGIALKRYGFGRHLQLSGVMTALKLLLHPLLVYVLAMHVFTMPPAWAGVAVLFASAPCGLNAYLFAERYRSGVAITASAISLSTALSIFTTTFWLAVLGVH